MVILYLPKAAILRGERESKYSMIVWERGTLQSILTISPFYGCGSSTPINSINTEPFLWQCLTSTSEITVSGGRKDQAVNLCV